MVEQRNIPTASHVRRIVGRTAVLVVVIGIAALFIGCASTSGQGSGEDRIERAGAAPASQGVPTGGEIFAANCAVCHGASGEGQPDWHIKNADGTLPPPPLNGDGHTWHHGDGLLYRIVSQGGALPENPSFKSGMPAFGDHLTHQEIIAVLTHVKSLWGDKVKRGISIKESQAIISQQDPFPAVGE